MEQSPSWEANWLTASQAIPHVLRNPKVNYSNYKWPPLVFILSNINPVHTVPSHFLNIQRNTPHPRLDVPSGLFPSVFPTKSLYKPLVSPIRGIFNTKERKPTEVSSSDSVLWIFCIQCLTLYAASGYIFSMLTIHCRNLRRCVIWTADRAFN
jgi:hypothetical protein